VQAKEDDVRPSPLRIVERDLAKLIKSYPAGKVFNYAASGTPYSGSDDSAGSGGASSESAAGKLSQTSRANTKHNRHARLLRKVVGDARSIAFYPIWDTANRKYRSCLIAWTLHGKINMADASSSLDYANIVYSMSHSHPANKPGVSCGASFEQKTNSVSELWLLLVWRSRSIRGVTDLTSAGQPIL
jgi:hypothetical protein